MLGGGSVHEANYLISAPSFGLCATTTGLASSVKFLLTSALTSGLAGTPGATVPGAAVVGTAGAAAGVNVGSNAGTVASAGLAAGAYIAG